jgi:hypothetical protein
MPFYRQLHDDRNRTTNYRLVFVGYEKEEDLKSYLAAHRIHGDEVVRSNFRLARVLGTPTVRIVSQNGELLGEWRGMQQARGEFDIRRVLRD